MDSEMNNDQVPNIGIWLGTAVGAAVGIGIALSRRKKSPWDSARGITKKVADHSGDLADATSNIVERMLTYALGRGIETGDRATVDEISRRVAANGYRFSTLVTEIVDSQPFQMRRSEH